MSNKNGWGDKPRCVRQTCNSDSGYIINTGSLLKAEESERQPVHLRRGFLVRGLCVVSDWGQIMETTCTLWCQRSTAGRLHNKSHCVLSSAHLQAGCGAFFFFLCMCSGNVRKKYQHNMVMCSLNLRTVKSGLQLVHNIICRLLRALSWQERETQRTDRKCALWHLHINDFLISVSDWCQRRTASFFLLLPFPYSYRELHSFSAEWSPPRPTKLYVPMSRCISAATCLSQQSGLTLVDSCGSQSMRSRRTLVELNSLLPPVQSPLNPPEYLVLLAVPVESQNTVANAAALWHLISPGDLLLSEF